MTVTVASKAAKKAAVEAAMGIAKDVVEGTLHPGALEAAAVAECRALLGVVAGPDDPLWGLQAGVARQVLAVGGGWITADELAEWAAVYRQAEGVEAAVSGPSWIELALAELDDDGGDGEFDPGSLLTETNDLPVSDL